MEARWFVLILLLAAACSKDAWAGMKIVFDDKSSDASSAVKELDIKLKAANIGKGSLPGTVQGPRVYFLDEIPASWSEVGAEIRGSIGALAVNEEKRSKLESRGVHAAKEMEAPCILVQESYWAALSEADKEALLAHEGAHLFDFDKMRTLPEDKRNLWFKVITQYLKLDLRPEVKAEIRSNYRVYEDYVRERKSESLARLIKRSPSGDEYFDLFLEGVDKSAPVGELLDMLAAQDRRKEHRFLQQELDGGYEHDRIMALQTALAPYLAHSELYARYEEAKAQRKNGVSFEAWAEKLKITYPPDSDGEVVYGYILKQMRKLWDAAGQHDLLGLFRKETGS
ncbi:MAG: hypothetical protein HY748_01680 [Elusimicrobia bacterium]|nr:hypothetical protein [Elusimicrobiota bacterium]